MLLITPASFRTFACPTYPEIRLAYKPYAKIAGALGDFAPDCILRLDLPGAKWVIGDGPLREELERRYPEVHFLGAKAHAELPAYYKCADVFVFPSKTDTFGLVLAEAMACGVPVAAYPVEGPVDVVLNGRSGMLNDDLKQACIDALTLDRRQVRAHA